MSPEDRKDGSLYSRGHSKCEDLELTEVLVHYQCWRLAGVTVDNDEDNSRRKRWRNKFIKRRRKGWRNKFVKRLSLILPRDIEQANKLQGWSDFRNQNSNYHKTHRYTDIETIFVPMPRLQQKRKIGSNQVIWISWSIPLYQISHW